MKKTYSKPDIFFEDFSLSTSIAAGCEEKPVNSTNDCGVKWDKDVYIFTQNMNGCTAKIADGSTNPMENLISTKGDALCYHNPSVNYNVFMS